MLGYKILGDVGDWVVCWPSLYNDHMSFSLFAEALARDHRVLCIDHPGMGLSKDIPLSPLGFLELSTIGAEVIAKEIGEEPFHFVGHGVGGHVGLAIAAKHANCESVTLSGTPFANAYSANIFSYHFSKILLKWNLSITLAKWMIIKLYSVGDGLERKLVSGMLDITLKQANNHTLVKLSRPDVHTIEHHRELLQRIKQPVLIIAGSYDRMSASNEQKEAARLARRGTFVEVKSGFMTFFTAAAECSRCWIQHKRLVGVLRSTPTGSMPLL